MRRAAAVVLGTLTGTALMVGAKIGNTTPGSDPALAGDGGGVVVDGGTNPAGPGVTASGRTRTTAPGKSPTPGTKPSTGGPTAPTGRPGPTATTPGRTPGPTRTTTKPPATTPPATTPPPSGPRDGTYHAQAPVRGGEYGTLSMSVTISGGRITSISASESGGETNCYHGACNTLKPEALAAQNANVASVSGATYTSSAFKSALSAILNTANA